MQYPELKVDSKFVWLPSLSRSEESTRVEIHDFACAGHTHVSIQKPVFFWQASCSPQQAEIQPLDYLFWVTACCSSGVPTFPMSEIKCRKEPDKCRIARVAAHDASYKHRTDRTYKVYLNLSDSNRQMTISKPE